MPSNNTPSQTTPNASHHQGDETLETMVCPNCQSRIASAPKDNSSHESQTDTPKAALVVVALICGLYLVMPSLGVFELIPDFIPVVGNLDEAAATTGLLFAANQLGWLSFFQKR